MRSFLFFACVLTAALTAASASAASGVMLKSEDLRAGASSGAASIGRVDKGAAVEIVSRRGGWTEIAAGGRKGWVRILSVRADASASPADLSGLIQAGTRRADSGRVVATAGLRGLSEEELKSARFDAGELLRLDRYQYDRAAAERYARSVGLRQRNQDYLPAPQSDPPKANEPASPWGGLL